MAKRLILFLLFLACQFAHFISSLWMLICIVVGSDRAWRIVLAYDRVGNAATGGKDTETISSRAYRGTTENNRGWCLLCRLLDYIEKNHCRDSAGV